MVVLGRLLKPERKEDQKDIRLSPRVFPRSGQTWQAAARFGGSDEIKILITALKAFG
jgi:hypothetical protein